MGRAMAPRSSASFEAHGGQAVDPLGAVHVIDTIHHGSPSLVEGDLGVAERWI